jgi:hypothetical protein
MRSLTSTIMPQKIERFFFHLLKNPALSASGEVRIPYLPEGSFDMGVVRLKVETALAVHV